MFVRRRPGRAGQGERRPSGCRHVTPYGRQVEARRTFCATTDVVGGEQHTRADGATTLFAILRTRQTAAASPRRSSRVEENMNRSELETTAQAMVAKGKGILAADESTGTIKKRFDTIQLESTEEARRSYRELLFTTPDVANYISGVILFDETIRQKTKEGTPFAQHLTKLGIDRKSV